MTLLAATILYASIRIVLLAVAVALILAVARVRSGAMRHAAWTAVLGAMLLMPVLPDVVPRIDVTVPRIVPAPPITPFEIGASVAPEKATPRVPQSPAPSQPARHIDWLSIAYLAVTAFLLLRLASGWQYARRLQKSGTLVAELEGVYESAAVHAPMTIGLLHPRVTLPIAWRDWPEAKLRAVLAHEREHVRRRDSLIGLTAHLNRCLFWFHPLAWWLERTLASSAEQACDEAGVHALGDSRQYAEILLSLVETVRDSGRFSWQAIRMDGTGRIGERIDRILKGEAPRASRRQKFLVAASCLVAVLLAAGCQQKVRTLIANRDMSQKAEQAEKQRKLIETGRSLNLAQAAELEKQLLQSDDLEVRTKLMVFYGRNATAQTMAARRAHVLWFIQHHPESEAVLAGQLSPSASDPMPDPVGYEQAKALWKEQTGDAQRDPQVLINAANFVKVADKPLAEQLLIRARELEPKATEIVAVKSASGQQMVVPVRISAPKSMAAILLGRLYYEALMGSNALMPMGVVRSVNLTDAHGGYANEVRRKLETTTDPVILAATGEMLVTWGRNLSARRDVDFDTAALGKSYCERALQLDPQSRTAHRTLAFIHRIERSAQLDQAFREKRFPQYVASLTGIERCYGLYKMAELEYMRFKEKNTRPNEQLEHAKQMAEESLELSASFRKQPDYGDIVYNDNMLLGMIAMYHGQRKEAVQYMQTAAEAPSTEELAYLQGILTFDLPRWLLKDGERQSVIDFLERFAKTNISERALLLDSAAAIHNGMRPTWYRD